MSISMFTELSFLANVGQSVCLLVGQSVCMFVCMYVCLLARSRPQF